MKLSWSCLDTEPIGFVTEDDCWLYYLESAQTAGGAHMVLDLIWAVGEVLGIVALLCGAYWVLMETEPFLSLFGKQAAVPLRLLPKDLRLIESFAKYDRDSHFLAGNGVMDAQHQGLSHVANDLRTAILSGQSVYRVSVIIDALIGDLVQHFRDEEAILAAAAYPGTAKHTALHRELVSSATTLAKQFRAGTFGIGKLFQFLARDVLDEHALGADRDFALYMGSRG